jgi:hypothetical protein
MQRARRCEGTGRQKSAASAGRPGPRLPRCCHPQRPCHRPSQREPQHQPQQIQGVPRQATLQPLGSGQTVRWLRCRGRPARRLTGCRAGAAAYWREEGAAEGCAVQSTPPRGQRRPRTPCLQQGRAAARCLRCGSWQGTPGAGAPVALSRTLRGAIPHLTVRATAQTDCQSCQTHCYRLPPLPPPAVPAALPRAAVRALRRAMSRPSCRCRRRCRPDSPACRQRRGFEEAVPACPAAAS